MKKSKIFFYSCLFFIVGVGTGSFFDEALWIGIGFLTVGCIVFLITYPNKRFLLIFLGGIFLFLGVLRYELSIEILSPNKISFYNNNDATFVGIVKKERDERNNHAKLVVEVLKYQDVDEWREVFGNVLVNASLYPRYEYGDRLEVTCNLKNPGVIRTEDGNDFAYDKYLAKDNIYSLCYFPKIKLLERDQGSFLISTLLKGKKKFVLTVNRILPEPQAAFLGGLLYGARRSIPQDLMEQFNITGTTHIIAISGYNITILVAMILSFAKGIGVSRKRSFWIALLGIIFFVIIAGGQASIIRAGIMGGLVLLANHIGRVSRIKNALILAAALMILINPKVLAYDVGFQLSFAATIGLVFLSPILEKYFKKWPSLLGVKESFLTTISAIVLTTPLILFTFGRLSLVAPITNILILPVIPFAMVWLILSYIIKVVEIFSYISWASINVGKISWVVLVLFYASILFFIYYKMHSPKEEKI